MKIRNFCDILVKFMGNWGLRRCKMDQKHIYKMQNTCPDPMNHFYWDPHLKRFAFIIVFDDQYRSSVILRRGWGINWARPLKVQVAKAETKTIDIVTVPVHFFQKLYYWGKYYQTTLKTCLLESEFPEESNKKNQNEKYLVFHFQKFPRKKIELFSKKKILKIFSKKIEMTFFQGNP